MKEKSVTVGLFILFGFGVIFAVTPLLGKKYIPTHDGEYHIIRIIEFSKMLGHGYIFPRWAPTLNSGYGMPVFQYNYPFPNYVGSLVRFFTQDGVYAFQIAQGIGYLLFCTSVFMWLSALFGLSSGLVGATVASFMPYIFVDLYVRGSIGEIWAMAFGVLCLWASEQKRYVLLSFLYGLLIISHNILAMIYTPFLIGYFLIRDKVSVGWLVAGLGLSAFFWIPALVESTYVVGLNTVNFKEHFVELYEMMIPSWGTEFSATGNMGNKISFQLGLISIYVFLRTLFYKIKNTVTKYFLIVYIIAIVLMLPVSKTAWTIVMPLQFTQYPWRFLSIIVPTSAYFASLLASYAKRRWMLFLLPIFAIMASYSYARPVLYAPRDEAYYLSRRNFTDGTSSLGNSFTTIWSPWKRERPKTLVETISGDASFTIMEDKPLSKSIRVSAVTNMEILVNVLYFPGWNVYVDGKNIPISYKDNGLISIAIPNGEHALLVKFQETPVRKLADILSILCLLWMVYLGILKAIYAYRDSHRSNVRRARQEGNRVVYKRTN